MSGRGLPPTLRRRLRPLLPALASATAALLLLAGLAALRRGDPVPVFFLQPVVLVLVSGSAYLLDDSARAVTDVVPRALLRRRTGIVLGGLGIVALAWALAVVFLDGRSPATPVAALTWEVAGVSCLCVATSAVLGRRGDAEPGSVVVSAVGLLFVGVLVAQPALHLRVLALTGDEPVRAGWWAGLVVAALATAAIASRDVASAGTRGAATGRPHRARS